MIEKLKVYTSVNDKVIDKVNEIVIMVNVLEKNIELIHIWMSNFRKELDEVRAKRVNSAGSDINPVPLEPLTNFGFRPEIYCTCGKNVTACCPIHPVMH